ncbi:hypothetical protein [Bacillus tuaregi]|uniref:hypothetical protein n=1 Tax=Bacillus tuaregi TaxID=1816695 RepID=UPI0008F7E88A|nr:hypothetical protein [Bacillus tuaregi]
MWNITKEQWFSDLDEKVLVGLISSTVDYHTFIQDGYYQLPVHVLKKGWQDAKYIALYAKNGVAKNQGVWEYGKIVDVTFVEVNQLEQVRFHVDYWRNLQQVITPVHYGIANYALTSINMLKEARELPELFLKSQNELVLWRMLRRVSDQIKITLNENNLDEATYVHSYSIKNIKIELNKAKREIVFKKGNQEKVVSIEWLEKQPSKVFRIVLELVND